MGYIANDRDGAESLFRRLDCRRHHIGPDHPIRSRQSQPAPENALAPDRILPTGNRLLPVGIVHTIGQVTVCEIFRRFADDRLESRVGKLDTAQDVGLDNTDGRTLGKGTEKCLSFCQRHQNFITLIGHRVKDLGNLADFLTPGDTHRIGTHTQVALTDLDAQCLKRRHQPPETPQCHGRNQEDDQQQDPNEGIHRACNWCKGFPGRPGGGNKPRHLGQLLHRHDGLFTITVAGLQGALEPLHRIPEYRIRNPHRRHGLVVPLVNHHKTTAGCHTEIAGRSYTDVNELIQKIVAIQRDGTTNHTNETLTVVENRRSHHDGRLFLIVRDVGLADHRGERGGNPLKILPVTDIQSRLPVIFGILGYDQTVFIDQVNRIEQMLQGCLAADQDPGPGVENITGHGEILGYVVECLQSQGQLVVQLPRNKRGNRFHLVTGLLLQLGAAQQETGNGYQQGRQDDRNNHQGHCPIRQATQPSPDHHDFQAPQRVRQPVMI